MAHLRVIVFGQHVAVRREVGNTVSELTGLIFEPQTSGSRNKSVPARSTGRSNKIVYSLNFRQGRSSSFSQIVYASGLTTNGRSSVKAAVFV